MKIAKYLDPHLIKFLKAKKRDEALSSLVDLLSNLGRVHKTKNFYQALLEREKIVSTGIGMGVAIPHAKMNAFKDFFIAVGIQKEKGLEWSALDHSPVRLIFMIGGPDNKQTEYLQILSGLTHAIKDEGLRKKLLNVSSSDEVIELLKDF